MAIFTCDGFRAVTAPSWGQAVLRFGKTAARRKFGPRACLRSVTLNDFSRDNRRAAYRVFVCRPTTKREPGQVYGQELMLFVYKRS